MLKIPKGLKKKKKSKKSKRKDEELFTEEELEQYKREHQAQPQPPENESEQQEEPKPGNDEWSKFNALTTGVDSILKKTQGDLDRIKSTSFFQRVPAGPKTVDRCGKDLPFRRDAQKEGQRWIDFEEQKQQQAEAFEPRDFPQPEALAPPPEPVFSESEYEEEEDDTLFDTSYVEAVEKGEVKLAFVPDSPEEEVDAGPDPFDTSYAEKVIKGPEVSKKGKKLVNIGAAVEVLTGRIDHVTTSKEAVKKAKRRVPRDLLLENPENDEPEPAEETIVSKSLLDDDTDDIPQDVPVDLSVSLHTQYIPPKTEEEDASKNQAFREFDVLADDDDDEFAQLATESLSKPTVVENVEVSFEPVLESDSWAEFEDPKKGKPSRPPPPRPQRPELPVSDLSPDDFECDGPDPFDTTFAENIAPGKAELKQIEREILNSGTTPIPRSDSDFDFDPRADEIPRINNRRKSSVHIHITDPTGIRESISAYDNGDVENFETLKPIHRDLLGGSSTDLTQLADSPIAPVSVDDDDDRVDYSDPFDTSIVDLVAAPGRTELKFIEKELLGESELKRSLSDPDFDPRAEELEKEAQRKPSRPENLFVNKSVLFKIPTDNESLLDAKEGKKSKPLTPYYSEDVDEGEEEDVHEDPYDTSDFKVENVKQLPSILKNAAATDIKRSSSNQDLNFEEEEFAKDKFSQLRRHSDFPVNFNKAESAPRKTDFLAIAEEESVDVKVLTPFQEHSSEVDPFDTSVASNVLLPGKTELKFLENEFLSHGHPLADDDFDPRSGETKPQTAEDLLAPSDDIFQAKALTPEVQDRDTGFLIETADDEIDPFDTSIANNIGPGKTELRLLESEFMN